MAESHIIKQHMWWSLSSDLLSDLCYKKIENKRWFLKSTTGVLFLYRKASDANFKKRRGKKEKNLIWSL